MDLGEYHHDVPVRNIDPRGHRISGLSEDSIELREIVHENKAGEPWSSWDTELGWECKRCTTPAHLAWRKDSDGEYRATAKKPCTVDVVNPYSVTLLVTSGALVFSDYLLNPSDAWPEEADRAVHGIGSYEGREKLARELELFGVAWGNIHSDSDLLVSDDRMTFEVVKPGIDELERVLPPQEGFSRVGSIEVGVWSYEFMDKERFLSLGGEITDKVQEISVANGLWEFTHLAHDESFPWDIWGEKEVFARARLKTPKEPRGNQ